MGYQQAQGAQIKYLARYRDRPVACLSFGPAAFRVAARDQFIGWSPPQRQERLRWVVNNDRFLVLPWVEVPHLASFVFSRCLRRLRSDWRQIYQQDLVLAETFIQKDRFVGCHRFGQKIAHLAGPLALNPCVLKGQGPKARLKSGAQEALHTIFLFDENSVTEVLDKYAELLLRTFTQEELSEGSRKGMFVAVGQVHKEKGDSHVLHHVGHCSIRSWRKRTQNRKLSWNTS